MLSCKTRIIAKDIWKKAGRRISKFDFRDRKMLPTPKQKRYTLSDLINMQPKANGDPSRKMSYVREDDF